MDPDLSRYSIKCIIFLIFLTVVTGETYNVKIDVEKFVNLVDSKFLSFTVDPKFLFSRNEKHNSKESICMASSLTPAYIQLAGPSTSQMNFENATISLHDQNYEIARKHILNQRLSTKNHDIFEVTHDQWKKFVKWINTTGFDLVFALNNDEKTESGMWDPNTALKILTVADQAHVDDIFWQLGYECKNQSIEEYLNDLQTLRVIVETFPRGNDGRWQVVGGDITKCLQKESKSDFKDYVTLSIEIMDAVLLNGNSSAQQLERMSESDRQKLLRLLNKTNRPLWLTEHVDPEYNQLERAADWMASLGFSAKNGFTVHFRELLEEELYEPTLSFYMALLYKNLVGERVLNVNMESSKAILFAHCTSLRHEPVPGAVTFFGANMDKEPARFSLKVSKSGQGGDIMQFVFGFDHTGNIIVNGRAMYHAGDIKPLVKRARPYKTLLLNLPPKSFGFWVLANTKIEACQNQSNDIRNTSEFEEMSRENAPKSVKVKRSIRIGRLELDDVNDVVDTTFNTERDGNVFNVVSKVLRKQFNNIGSALKRVFGAENNSGRIMKVLNRNKRHTINKEQDGSRNSMIQQKLKNKQNTKEEQRDRLAFIDRLFHLKPRFNRTRRILGGKFRTRNRFPKEKISKRVLDHDKSKGDRRVRRNVNEMKEDVSENEIEYKDKYQLAKILKRIHKMLDTPYKTREDEDEIEYEDKEEESSKSMEVEGTLEDKENKVVVEKKKLNRGIFKTTLEKILSVLEDLNKNLSRFWDAFTL